MAAEAIDKILTQEKSWSTPQNAFERFFFSIGLMTGPNAPWYRFGFGAALGAILMWAVRPSFAFTDQGRARPWSIFAPTDPDSTMIPWWLLPVGLAFFFGVFV